MSQNGQSASSRLMNHNMFSSPSSVNDLSNCCTSQSASWSHSTLTAGGNSNSSQDAGGLAIHQHSTAPGTEYGVNLAENGLSPQSSSQSGTTLKEHDLLGQSEVSSSSTVSSPKRSFDDDGELNLNLNLGSTELRLGPQDGRRESGFQLQRGLSAIEQGLAQPSDTGKFLGGLDVGKGADKCAPPSERRLSNTDQNGAATDQFVERGFGPSAPSQTGRVDTTEVSSIPCRPLIESESLQKRHFGDCNVGPNETLNLGMSLMQQQQQPKRALDFDDGAEKAFQTPGDRFYREKPHQEDPSFYKERTWAERNQQQHSSVQPDVSPGDKIQERHMTMSREHTAETPTDLGVAKPEVFYPEKRSLPETLALPPLQPAEARFNQDISAPERSPRSDAFRQQQNHWHYQAVLRAADVSRQVPLPDFHGMHMAHSAHQDESPRHILNGPPLGGFPGPRLLQPQAPSKAGVSGAKRPYDTIGVQPDARNFDMRSEQPQQQPGPVLNGNVLAQNDAKSKGQGPLSHQSWSPKPSPAWQMMPPTGGSFGPFPSKPPNRVPPLSPLNKPAPDASGAGGDPAQKVWETHVKNLQEPASSSQTMSCTAENKPGALQDTSPCTDSGSPPRAASAQAVGWPPLRSFRKNVLAATPRPSQVESQTRPPPPPPLPTAQAVASPVSVASQPNSWFVKVYMDGVPIGRKVDLKTNSSYDKLSLVLEDMFRGFVNGQQSSQKREITLPSDKRSFLRGSDYVLTYEDQDGDLMLVGDVPWTLFIDTVKRLRIMKGSEAIGLGNRAAEKVHKAQPIL